MTDPLPSLRGKLKIYLGYAAGVGKTYQMLEEAQELQRRSVDVVIGYFEPHGRKDTIAKTEGLEVIPRKVVEYRGARFEEMDTDAILARRPQVAVVDEFPHTNVPGSENGKRWADVMRLLEAGIDVLTTMNVQHLESLNDQVWQITGVRVRETLPDWVMKLADEVVMVDVTPRALLNRLERGVVYSPEKAQRALQNFFKETNLVALRELALRQTAHEVEVRNEEEEELAEPEPVGASGDAPAPVAPEEREERVLVHITSAPSTAMVLRRGKRVADYLRAECFAVYVHEQPTLEEVAEEERESVKRHLNFARNLHIETRILAGKDVAKALVEFARANQVTHIFMARAHYPPLERLLGRNLIHQVVGQAVDMQVTIVAERHRHSEE